MIQKCLDKWTKKRESKGTLFAAGKEASRPLISARKFPKLIAQIWKRFHNDIMPAGHGADKTTQLPDCLSFDFSDESDWFKPNNGHIDTFARSRVILDIWQMGKDPSNILSWIEYIITSNHSRSYADPSSNRKFSAVKKRELQNALYYLTGFRCSASTLWTLLTRELGYRLRQCQKFRQVGEAHPLKDVIYRHIRNRLARLDPSTTLCLSIDTKAALQLGLNKHDNGVLLCSPDGKVFKVADHDFPFDLSDIYQACLHPSRI